MKSIFEIVDVLSKQVEFITHTPSVVLNEIPSVFSENMIYIISPSENNISITPHMTSDSKTSFDVTIFQIAHEKNMNRQGVLVEDVKKAFGCGDLALYKSLNRITGLDRVADAVVKDVSYGTSTWVTDTKIYSGFKITLSMLVYLDY